MGNRLKQILEPTLVSYCTIRQRSTASSFREMEMWRCSLNSRATQDGTSAPDADALADLAARLHVRREYFLRPVANSDRPLFYRILASNLVKDLNCQDVNRHPKIHPLSASNFGSEAMSMTSGCSPDTCLKANRVSRARTSGA
ncbi:hypothetical protein GGI59_002905 [Rhizobium lentis]|uniref:Uncharacterized protein n=1 Tax=Rhizobium lentis TaxID=1138194 RepID=A0A7W8XDK2_9HYPH|nr:hypothetical protein [Rhizobium lentis]MBB5550648.1 hypothetical protein [Rhizobium lentis]MBB5561230.1 hypothetical protein [Rhizobium lentis]MBB5567767.1 hypothetical protein [Rhizobium lentis]